MSAAHHFHRDLVDGAPCKNGNVLTVELHGLTLLEQKGVGFKEVTLEFPGDTRSLIDVSQLAQFMTEETERRGAKDGQLLAMWAMQLCGHRESGKLIGKTRLERLGAWFLPTAEVYEADRTSITREEPYREPLWKANAYKLNRQGKIASIAATLTGITLPRTTYETAHVSAHEAVLLAQVGRKKIFGFLHNFSEPALGAAEQILPPPISDNIRPNCGTMLRG